METILQGGMQMLNSMIVGRQRVGDYYNLILQIPESEYFDIYEDLDKEAARDIVKQYMTYHGDDGRCSDVEIHHNKSAHIVGIRATLHYDDNDYTEQFIIPHHLED